MKKELKVSAASKVVTMAYCPKDTDYSCGIQYRSA